MYDEYGFLCNDSYSAIKMGGEWYYSVEHRYQSAKATNDKDHDAVRNTATPEDARKVGRTIPLREDWSDVKVMVMYIALKEKFRQNRELRTELFITLQKKLIYDDPKDYFWGQGDGTGQNMLGYLLMVVRGELRG